MLTPRGPRSLLRQAIEVFYRRPLAVLGVYLRCMPGPRWLPSSAARGPECEFRRGYPRRDAPRIGRGDAATNPQGLSARCGKNRGAASRSNQPTLSLAGRGAALGCAATSGRTVMMKRPAAPCPRFSRAQRGVDTSHSPAGRVHEFPNQIRFHMCTTKPH